MSNIPLANPLAECSNIVPFKKGGQKQVLRANHSVHGPVVIKIGNYGTDRALQRITREVELLRSLDRPHFPKNYDFIVDLVSREFIILEEYIDAQVLSEQKPKFNTEESIVALLLGLVNAMQEVWEKRIVHRDLKPDNILVDLARKPYIIDFGIARFLDAPDLTKTLAMMGPATVAYAAPEQLENRKTDIGPRTDFFALGIICLELHLQYHPFEPGRVGGGSMLENIVLNTRAYAEAGTGASPEFMMLTNRLLGPQPYQRFRSCQEIQSFINQNWSVV